MVDRRLPTLLCDALGRGRLSARGPCQHRHQWNNNHLGTLTEFLFSNLKASPVLVVDGHCGRVLQFQHSLSVSLEPLYFVEAVGTPKQHKYSRSKRVGKFNYSKHGHANGRVGCVLEAIATIH